MKHLIIVGVAVATATTAGAQTAPVAQPSPVAPVAQPTAAATLSVAPMPPSRAIARERRRPPSSAELRVRAANRDATREPSFRGFVNAVQIYPFNDGTLYRLIAAPERVTDIALQPGEAIISVAAGDTVRWTVGDTTSGTGPTRRVHILIKPFSSGLSTNLLILTDRRSYHLQLESTGGTAMAGLSWTYPQDELIAIRRQQAVAEAATPVASELAIDRLNFSYAITGDKPEWRPVRAFDDGRQTFVEFAPSVAVGEAPPLFVIGDQGEAQLVNYRMAGHYYVVDRLFDAAELRLGGKKQAIVRITRTDRPSRRRRAS